MNTRSEENKAIRRLRRMTDFTCQLLQNPKISLSQAMNLIYETRREALTMFPDKSETFDMIYGRRFIRILEQKGKFFSSMMPFWN
ncbi:MAG: hypothetical protein GF372_01400 [Candidatus Marinimicrobia bacterium]|jgi:hypothetical protein|nr:hypothetical protein [Candidatus Neomarinimicrobiota bacterium]